MGPGDLAQALCGLELIKDPNLIVGLEKADDAGVYKLRDDLAIIQTIDFFTPIVDDPFVFGQIAAANAMSDVYAMGGTPICAMNIVCFPVKEMDIALLREILRGGLEKMQEAGVVLAGGHTVEDRELKYGLSVTGTVNPRDVLRNQGGHAGDLLILTKPIGTGIVNTAIKAELATQEAIDKITTSMMALNRQAAELMCKAGVHACTDVTGFGLLGHACEMIEGSDVGICIDAHAVPIFPEAKEYARMGLIPAGLYRNSEFRKSMITADESIPIELLDIFFDPQTSGGLLMALPTSEADALLKQMHQEGIPEATVIGELVGEPRGRIVVR